MFSWLRMAVICIVVAFLTRFIPFSDFFRNVNTLVHELAHAIAALLLKGSVMHIHLYADQSGVTNTSYTDNWMSIPIALAGYIGASLFTLLLFYLHARGHDRIGLACIALAAGTALALFIRNGYGMAWSGGFAALTAFVLFAAPDWLRKGYYLLIAFICLVESIVSPFIVLYLAVTDPAMAGDAASLSQAAYLPASVWAFLFCGFSLWCARAAVGCLFRSSAAGIQISR
ncbi:branched-subunit amino acid transport protein AzlD [Paenibacillus endophyticus]|uniref:Branched-subunit amino acid transport protein AzlD n=1 Tax=Paenibacillus endophyticus TaxID=1294268 RepID=A0A7W5G9V1_9BACL|nr:M50 family metallopeptidase [Paenibacillus endophyticus]MBB3152574.1 branched-subunit amino acid transport protein AzlD [Paenibacillus endophyticus]